MMWNLFWQDLRYLTDKGPFINTLVGSWKISILVRENFFDPPLAIPKTFWPPFQCILNFFDPSKNILGVMLSINLSIRLFLLFWCPFLPLMFTNQLNLKKTWTESFWYTSTLGHYEEGKGKNLFWRIDGVGATYTDSFIWTWIYTT